MLRAFVEVDRAIMGPERLGAKLTAYARLHSYVPAGTPGDPPEPAMEELRRHYPLFPRLLFILDGTGPTGIENRIDALRAAARDLALFGFLHEVPVLTAPLTDLLRDGPTTPIWRPVQDPTSRVSRDHPGTRKNLSFNVGGSPKRLVVDVLTPGIDSAGRCGSARFLTSRAPHRSRREHGARRGRCSRQLNGCNRPSEAATVGQRRADDQTGRAAARG